jgi:hypothetical protein
MNKVQYANEALAGRNSCLTWVHSTQLRFLKLQASKQFEGRVLTHPDSSKPKRHVN